MFALRGQKNFGIDFKGGDRTVLSTNRKLDTRARCAMRLQSIGQGEATIQSDGC